MCAIKNVLHSITLIYYIITSWPRSCHHILGSSWTRSWASSWQDLGENLAGIILASWASSWQVLGKFLASSWQVLGKFLASSWQVLGRNLAQEFVAGCSIVLICCCVQEAHSSLGTRTVGLIRLRCPATHFSCRSFLMVTVAPTGKPRPATNSWARFLPRTCPGCQDYAGQVLAKILPRTCPRSCPR